MQRKRCNPQIMRDTIKSNRKQITETMDCESNIRVQNKHSTKWHWEYFWAITIGEQSREYAYTQTYSIYLHLIIEPNISASHPAASITMISWRPVPGCLYIVLLDHKGNPEPSPLPWGLCAQLFQLHLFPFHHLGISSKNMKSPGVHHGAKI